jgi:hypothetical protein
MEAGELRNLDVFAEVHSRFDDAHPPLKRKIRQITVQYELYR